MIKAIPSSYSSLSTLAKCARKYFYAYELGLESRAPSAPLRLGEALHVGLHILHTGGDIDTAIAAALVSWGEFRLPPAHRHAYATAGLVEAVLRSYVADRGEWISESQAVGFGEFVAEGMASAEIAPDITVRGKLDLPTKIGDNYVLIDHKTTGDWLSSYWSEQFEFSHQLRLYLMMLRKITGLPFDRAYINGLYCGAGALDPDDAWKKRKSPRSSLYGPFIFSEAHFQETVQWVKGHQWHHRSLLEGMQFFSDSPETAWPQNDTSRGCQGCEYRGVCKASPPIRSGILQRDFKEKTHVL